MINNKLWQAKLAARVHDPAEKCLVLMRDPLGHEGGTSRNLKNIFFPTGLENDIKQAIKKADHWASAADRPQFPIDANNRYASWTQVRFDQLPEIIHPLTGSKPIGLGKLEIDPEHIKAFSTDSFIELIIYDEQKNIDYRKTLLNFWRFGSELNPKGLAHLWRFMPADTRIPDHTIWAHLDLTSAFTGAFLLDQNQQPSLLSMSFGPVQSFIASGRSTSDLWAGSHLLSRIAWEGMKVICERLGPDAIVFPQLRGVPFVDMWLVSEVGLAENKFKEIHCEWLNSQTDANPLFSAVLPNKFVAIVPSSIAKELAEQVTSKVRSWVYDQGLTMLNTCLQEARDKITITPDLYCFEQLQNQLEGFPEVYWAAVPWLCKETSENINIDDLQNIINLIYPNDKSENQHFLASELWKILKNPIDDENNWRFYKPNPGVLYPAIYDLLDRVSASAKSVRPFKQSIQTGYRNTLTGEYEWLTTDKNQLNIPPGSRQNTLWQNLAVNKLSWVKDGEYLSALDMIKRLWPSQFINEIKDSIDVLQDIKRYTVSTHSMAFSTSFEQWLKSENQEKLGSV